jgi:hypothetical protein
MNKGVNDRHFVCLTDKPTACDQQIYQIMPRDGIAPRVLGINLNSTLTAMFAELIGRCNFGQGVLWLATYEIAQFLVLNPSTLTPEDQKELERLFSGFAERKPLGTKDELGTPERKSLDNYVMSFLKLTKGEREAVYEAVISLVETRLKKASSLDPKQRRSRGEVVRKTVGIWSDLSAGSDDDESPEEE